jgi:hypothetical protein
VQSWQASQVEIELGLKQRNIRRGIEEGETISIEALMHPQRSMECKIDTKIILLLNVVNIWKSKDFLDLTKMVLLTSYDKMYIYITNLIKSQVSSSIQGMGSGLDIGQ